MRRHIPLRELLSAAKTGSLGELVVETTDQTYRHFRGPLGTIDDAGKVLTLMPLWLAASGNNKEWRFYSTGHFVLPLDTPISQIVEDKGGASEDWPYLISVQGMKYTIHGRARGFSLKPSEVQGISSPHVRALWAWELGGRLKENSTWDEISRRAVELKRAGEPGMDRIIQRLREERKSYPG